MNPDNSDRLRNAFLRLYPPAGQHLDAPETAFFFPFEFECDDGWTELIYQLSAAIMKYAESAGLDPVASQVKEKYGELRIYLDGSDEVIDRLVDDAEMISGTICEVCGRPGVLITRGWHRTRCKICR